MPSVPSSEPARVAIDPLPTDTIGTSTVAGPPVSAALPELPQLATRIATMLRHRLTVAETRLRDRMQTAQDELVADMLAAPRSPLEIWSDWWRGSLDFAQRSVLLWDTMRQRGNDYRERVAAGSPPLLHFAFETVLDARTFDRPANYALVRITAPKGVTTDDTKRPYIIIDPRAGHGPGIGGFKDDSQVGVALRADHPVYFVIFFPRPEPGQTLMDVCDAERRFVHEVRRLHPESDKPAIVGNCQGGWAAMMLAASDPHDTGPLVINGAPMSYWGGAGSDGAGDNPMRYSGGLLGGSWLASLMADLGNGVFDGAYLVQNFENLNPANTLWDKPYNVFANIDTEPPRYLQFERWWGGFYLMNRDEIEWIVGNLFVGNRAWTGQADALDGGAFDLRAVQAPIILFASMGDNITPPQQAFNWVADIYGSTEEIKAHGQVIVGLVHESVGHLGIFVSGRVARKEHAQIVSVLEAIDTLPPGLYAMRVTERTGDAGGGEPEYDVHFEERTLEEVVARINRFGRNDERPFESVAQVSEFNQRAYETFARPLVQALANEHSAEVARQLHPLRMERWAVSDLNPWLWWLEPTAEAVKANRQAVDRDDPARRVERMVAELVSASLDHWRAVRDAMSESLFFSIYGTMFTVAPRQRSDELPSPTASAASIVADALATMEQGGYDAAFARVAELLLRDGAIPLATLDLRTQLRAELAPLLPACLRDDSDLGAYRRIRGTQRIIVANAHQRAIETLPTLLGKDADRRRLLKVLDRIEMDRRVQATQPTAAQRAMLARIRATLGRAT